MYRVPLGAFRRLRWSLVSAAVIVAFLAATVDDADARGKRKRGYYKRYHHAQTYRVKAYRAKAIRTASSSYGPKGASIIVDANTGETLHESNPDALRHPASLTKIMTLYLLFERLEAGKIRLNSQMNVSAEAASQAPTKLGLRPGQTLDVEDAIKGLVTKSANDASVVIAENLAGSEDEFARQMTRKARALGMSKTIYRNASGLPNDEQVTTARDQALLGLAIQERFPRYYRYFSTSSFTYNGRAMRNHNRLLGRVHGVDGIKTGYTRASGFNLVTSTRRGDRHIIGVVLGGSSGGARDARMRDLIEGHVMEASVRQTRTRIVEQQQDAPAPVQAQSFFAPQPPAQLASASSIAMPAPSKPRVAPPSIPAEAAVAGPRPGTTDPIKPVMVKTVAVRLTAPKTVAAPTPAPAPIAAKHAPIQTAALGPAPVSRTVPAPQPAAPAVEAKGPPPGARPGILGVLPVAMAAAGDAISTSAKAADAPPARTSATRSGWAIQIGAYEAETEAKQKLSAAKSKATGILGKADPYTERTTKGEKTYYRARFAGFDRDQAEAACKQLKRSDMACMALKI
jgi:D-alanyl-D-alanine carboxypeptidase